MKYFAYGSNMKETRLRERAPSARKISRVLLPGYQFAFNKQSKDNSVKANIEKRSGKVVWGVLYEIADSEQRFLDKAEAGYKRVPVIIINDNRERIAAETYLSTNTILNDCPYDWYKQLVIEGARESNLPENYVQEIEKEPSKQDRRDGA